MEKNNCIVVIDGEAFTLEHEHELNIPEFEIKIEEREMDRQLKLGKFDHCSACEYCFMDKFNGVIASICIHPNVEDKRPFNRRGRIIHWFRMKGDFPHWCPL